MEMTGALYLGFAALNMHFLTAGIAMAKLAVPHPAPWYIIVLTVAYGILATSFGVVLGRHPLGPAGSTGESRG